VNWTELAEEITQQPASGSGGKLSGLVRKLFMSLLVVMAEAGFRVARSLTPEPQATCSRAGRARTAYC